MLWECSYICLFWAELNSGIKFFFSPLSSKVVSQAGHAVLSPLWQLTNWCSRSGNSNAAEQFGAGLLGFHSQILGGEDAGMAPVRICWMLPPCPWSQSQLALRQSLPWPRLSDGGGASGVMCVRKGKNLHPPPGEKDENVWEEQLC